MERIGVFSASDNIYSDFINNTFIISNSIIKLDANVAFKKHPSSNTKTHFSSLPLRGGREFSFVGATVEGVPSHESYASRDVAVCPGPRVQGRKRLTRKPGERKRSDVWGQGLATQTKLTGAQNGLTGGRDRHLISYLICPGYLGRKAIGIEIEEKYCEIAVKRLSQEVFNFEKES